MSDYANIKYAQIEKLPEMDEKKKWFGLYKGVRFEIHNWKRDSDGLKSDCWTHYIIVDLDNQLDKEKADSLWLQPKYSRYSEGGAEHLNYDYYDSAINKLEFHGGCTFYQKDSLVDAKSRVVKIGCDYMHIWDDYMDYDLSYVHSQVKKSIDSLESNFGPIKIRSWGDGKYRLVEEFIK